MAPKVHIASPCSADWERMEGDNRVRFCRECNLNVYNFSAMEIAEISQLIANREERLCARFYQRPDGTMLTQNCPVGFRARVRRFSRIAGAALSAAMSASMAVAQTPAKPDSALVHIEGNESGISVRVIDPSGAVVSDAEVSLLNEANREPISAKTDATGKARLSQLGAGPYVLAVHFGGFETYTENVTIKPHQTQNFEVTLRLALMGEVLMVKSPGPVSKLFHKLF